MRRSGFLATIACLGLACAQETPTPALVPASLPIVEQPTTGDTLVVAYRGDVDGFDPVIARSSATMELLELLYPSLSRAAFDDCRLSFAPGLAEAWSWGDDGRTLTLQLRADRSWQDGQRVDVDDLIATLTRLADPSVGSPRGFAPELLRATEPWTRRDDHTLDLHFAEPVASDDTLARVFVTPIAPAHAEPISTEAGPTVAEDLIASGPFLLDRWEPGQRIRLVRREGAPAEQTAYLDAVEVRILPDAFTRRLAFEQGEVDMLLGVQAPDLARILEQRPDVQVSHRGRRFLDFVGWNLERPPFDDVRVRTAMAHAVDVDLLIDALLVAGEHRLGERAVGPIPPQLCHATDPDLSPLPRDLPRARQLLAEAGWEDPDGSGRLFKDGQRLEFTLLYSAGHERREAAAVILQQQLAELGVEVSLLPVERLALYEKLRRGEFEAALVGWAMGLRIDPSPFWLAGGPYNFVGYDNPRVAELIAAGVAAPDPAAADDSWRELQRQLHQDQPYLFLFWSDEVAVLDPRFEDARITPVAVFEDLHRWWVPAGRQLRPGH
jgi:peptide/nickel transport system substrate-binding protein